MTISYSDRRNLLRSEADFLESRMPAEQPQSEAEAAFQSGFADAVAILILRAEGKL